ncbi:di-heme oxidoredictase family protein [Pseudomonas sp. 5P_3.1_Bac2]|uniref:di-heme oxidoreductase family protein n=1 Tax=Pseudomonas sp. 5P_3.1_Bac2 TaxID=2971617 RepID=UPI0021C64516|nr:di-heme oxidoredictase family protein [Pseudomonas sp. 5P_3.1_Bac2]MCU1715516.1 c-type cytochrome [Pseudomonas sp. 5P_3.1_Bac2]
MLPLPLTTTPLRLSLALTALLAVAGCEQSEPFTQAEPGEALSGGAGSVRRSDHNAFAMPSANLSPQRRLDFSVGNSFFRSPWVIAPTTTTARDGLGPLFNSNACQNCHRNDGRGHPPEQDASSAVSMLVRLSIPATSAEQDQLKRIGVVPEPTYGSQLQDMAIPGVQSEAKVRLSYSTQTVAFADGTTVELRRPELQLSQLAYGALHPATQLSVRVAPPMIGLGLLEAISTADILANADPDDVNGDGISGRANQVWDRQLQRTVLGRFGWKAGQPTLNQQNADAFANDMGLTSALIPHDNCTSAQPDCLNAVNGGSPEVSPKILASVLFYTRNLAVPMRRDVNSPQVLAGKQLFHQAGCAQCHIPQFTTVSTTAEPEQANQVIRPYSDLLLHDMGAGLADQRSEFAATGQEWRTAPLWGLGLTQAVSGHTQLLHDGRARSVLEAILWHAGEAEAAKQQVLTFNAEQRSALLAFLNSL